jgi:acyl-CoA thioester hydrolase
MIPRPPGVLAANLLGRRLGSDSINGYIVSYLGNSREFPDHHSHRNLAMNPQHDLQIRVRYQETDAMGRLHHANYPTYFELGRTEALRAEGHTYREVEEQGVFLVVSELTCRYLRPANYDDVLTLRTTMISARGARIEHEYQLFRGTLLLATGRTTVACVDKLGNVKRLPDWLQLPAP